jgi:hypothetical protein
MASHNIHVDNSEKRPLLSVARYILRCETATWNTRFFPDCDLCEADDNVQGEQHVIFYCTHPYVVSLCRKFAPSFTEATAQDVFSFLHQNNNKLHLFLHKLIAFYEQASSRAL